MVTVVFIQLIIIAILGLCVFWLSVRLRSAVQSQHTAISLQLYQQLESPVLSEAVAAVRRMDNHQFNGHNGHHELPLPERQQLVSVREVDRYFAQVGGLVRRGVADDEIFALMGPTISEMWRLTRPVRDAQHDKESACSRDDFEWLYVEWLNWYYSHRDTQEIEARIR